MKACLVKQKSIKKTQKTCKKNAKKCKKRLDKLDGLSIMYYKGREP